MSDYEELKKRAMLATPGPWVEVDDEDSAGGAVFIIPDTDLWTPPICRITIEADAAFIAAANPHAVLGLIADLESYQQGAKAEADAGDEVRAEVVRLKSEVARSTEREILQLAEIESLRKVANELRRFSVCEHMHHDRPDQHEADEPCKVLTRIDAIIAMESL